MEIYELEFTSLMKIRTAPEQRTKEEGELCVHVMFAVNADGMTYDGITASNSTL